MSEAVNITGTVIHIDAPQAFGAKGFKKATCVVKTINEKYPQEIPVDALGKRSDLYEEAGVRVGASVSIDANLQGRRWNDSWFVSLSAWRCEVLGREEHQGNPSHDRAGQAPARPQTETTDDVTEEDDDLPF